MSGRRAPFVPSLVATLVLGTGFVPGGCFRAIEPTPGATDADERQRAMMAAPSPDETSPDQTRTDVPRADVPRSEESRPAGPRAAAEAAVSPAPTVTPGLGHLAGQQAALPPLRVAVPDALVDQGSVEIEELATVFADADLDSPALGLIAAGTRVAVVERVIAEGCPQAWLGVFPHGYVCSTFTDSKRAPSSTVLPKVPGGRRIPGTYGRVDKEARIYRTLADARANVQGRVSGAGLMVRRMKQVKAGGQAFWKTSEGWIAAKHVRKFGGSAWQGVSLLDAGPDAPTLPLGWVLPEAMLAKVAVRESPKRGAKVVRWLSRRERVALATGEPEHGYLALREGGYVEKARLAVARAAERPVAASADERWLDIDLAQQTLVAYVGDAPVYATLISSGKPGHSTPTGVFRLSRKVAERTMNSMADSQESYSVAKVPWTAYFATGYALHAAYWHDGFGFRKSHGCVNLSPLDARALYAWTAPLVAPGWTEVFGHEDQPGSVVRIRSRRDPAPETSGYAKSMLALAQR